VVGLLQSTESVSSSGIIVQPAPPPIIPPTPPTNPPPPPPEPAIEIDIYCDSLCTEKLSNFQWGEIEVGSSVNFNFYLKNNGESGVTLSLMTENWTPEELENNVHLLWNYDETIINPGNVREITLTLLVDSEVTNIDNFNFDIIIIGSAS